MIDWTQITDEDVLAALRAAVPTNPTGASYIDVLDQWGAYGAIHDAIGRLETAGKIKQTSPGNYLPVEA